MQIPEIEKVASVAETAVAAPVAAVEITVPVNHVELPKELTLLVFCAEHRAQIIAALVFCATLCAAFWLTRK